MEFCSVYGVILADVYIVRVGAYAQIGAVRYVGKGLILGSGYFVGLSVDSCLVKCFFCLLAGDNVVGYAVFHKVHGDHCKLQMRASLEKQHLVVGGDCHEIAEILFGFI